ncbi:MAG: HAD family hydrolase [Anaerolineales bacterium]|jgi:putative hydrolase of the HAD superfamily
MNLERLDGKEFSGIFFDFDGTLRHNHPPALEVFYQIAAELGVQTDRSLQRRGERWVNEYWADSDELKRDIDRFGVWRDNGDFWANHARRHLLVLGLDDATASELAPEITLRMRTDYEPVDCMEEDVLPTFDFLRQASLKVAIVSNRSEPFHDLVGELGLAEHVDLILAAGEVGWYKPDPRILLHAAELMEQDPEQVMYVGDNFHADILGANAAGMTPALYDPRDLYPDAECIRIRAVGELQAWIQGR